MKLAWVLALTAAAAPVAADDAVPVFPGPGAWTVEIITRPLTLKRGMIGVAGDLDLARTVVTDFTGMTSSATTEHLSATARYGITDRIELGASYALALHPFEAEGAVAGHALVGIVDREPWKLAPGATFAYDLQSEISTLRAGAAVQYNLTPRLAVIAPPTQLRITVQTPIGMGVPIPRPSDLGLPVGLGLQATEHVFASLETRLATIEIKDSATTFILADATPLTARVLYSPSNRLDVGATLDVQDLGDISDIFTLVITARLFVR